MKKLLAFTLCIMLMFAMSIPAFAEETTTAVEETTAAVEETTSDAFLFDGGISTQKVLDWFKENFEEISVIVSLIVALFYEVKKHSSLNKSIDNTNDNAVTIAENSEAAVKAALTQVETAAATVGTYIDVINTLLDEVRYNAEKKAELEAIVAEINTNFKTAKLANLELANEIADLLVLANIPNSVKEELHSRHRAAVAAIADAERTEVKEDEGKES